MAQTFFPEHTHRVYLHEVRLNKGGYNRFGVYYGCGKKLYYIGAQNEEGTEYIYEDEFRARNRKEAIEIARLIFPNGKFRK